MEALLVAVLSSPVLIWLLTRLDRRNTEQHANSMSTLKEIHDSVNQVGNDVKEVRNDLYEHIAFHAHKEKTPDGITTRTGTGETTSDLLRGDIA